MLQSGLEDLGADGLLPPPVPSPPGRGETARFALTGEYSPTAPSTSNYPHFLTYKGPVEVRFSRIEVHEPGPRIPGPPHIGHLLTCALHSISGLLRRCVHAVRGPGLVGPDTCRAARDSGPPSSGPSRTTKRPADRLR